MQAPSGLEAKMMPNQVANALDGNPSYTRLAHTGLAASHRALKMEPRAVPVTQ